MDRRHEGRRAIERASTMPTPEKRPRKKKPKKCRVIPKTVSGLLRISCANGRVVNAACMWAKNNHFVRNSMCKAGYMDDLTEWEKRNITEVGPAVKVKNIYSITVQRPFHAYEKCHHALETNDHGQEKTEAHKMFFFWAEIGRQLLQMVNVDNFSPTEMGEESAEPERSEGPDRYNTLQAEATARGEPLVQYCIRTNQTYPLKRACYAGGAGHTAGCFCGVDLWNRDTAAAAAFTRKTVAEQRADPAWAAAGLRPESQPVPVAGAGSNDEHHAPVPIVLLEQIPEVRVEEGTGLKPPGWLRWLFVIPEGCEINFEQVVLQVLSNHKKGMEAGSKRKRGAALKVMNKFQRYREIRDSREFLELFGMLTWKNPKQFLDGKLCAMAGKKNTRENLKPLLKKISSFEHQLKQLNHGYTEGVGWKNSVQERYPGAAPRCFEFTNYVQQGFFNPTVALQRNMLLLNWKNLKLNKYSQFSFLHKYNLWHYTEALERYERQFLRGNKQRAVLLPRLTTTENPTGEKHRPLTEEQSEFTDSFDKDCYPTTSGDITTGELSAKEGVLGADSLLFRSANEQELEEHYKEGKKLETNQAGREHDDKWVKDGLCRYKIMSQSPNVFPAQRGCFEECKRLAHKLKNKSSPYEAWNPIFMRGKLPAPNVGIGDAFIHEMFHAAETLMFLSTHTEMLYFGYICSGDAFSIRCNKNHCILVGAADAGKSHIYVLLKDHFLVTSTIMSMTKQSDAAGDDWSICYTRLMFEEFPMDWIEKDPKYVMKQDQLKNMITNGKNFVAKKEQELEPDTDIKRWKTILRVTMFSCQIVGSTNWTSIRREGVKAMLSRLPPRNQPRISRKKRGPVRGRHECGRIQSVYSQQVCCG